MFHRRDRNRSGAEILIPEADIPENEAARLAALRAYDVLDTDYDPIFDQVVDTVAAVFEAPVALISLVDEDRLWYMATRGSQRREGPRKHSFCSRAIVAKEVLDVPDIGVESRFSHYADNGMLSYAGAPLMNEAGFPLGTVCVIGHAPRPALSESQRAALQKFAALVVMLLDNRTKLHRLERVLTARGQG